MGCRCVVVFKREEAFDIIHCWVGWERFLESRFLVVFFFDFFFLTTKKILVTFQWFFFLAPGHREPKSSKTFLVTFYCSFFRFFFLHQKKFWSLFTVLFFDFFFLDHFPKMASEMV